MLDRVRPEPLEPDLWPRTRSERCAAVAVRVWLPALAASLFVLAGCGLAPSEVSLDAGMPYDAPPVPRRTLVVDGATRITIAPLAERTLRVRLTDDAGANVFGADVAFVLEGMPRSSTLRRLAATTDRDGVASVVLVAGPLATTFRVRATSTGAAPALIDVSVGTEFGELQVDIAAETTRAVETYVVRASAETACAEVPAGATGDGRRLGTELASTTFPALSTEASWTIDVRGESATGTTLARGCVEGVRVSATAPSRMMVLVRDLPLDAVRAFDLDWTLEASEIATSTRARALADVGDDGGASVLLDGLGLSLASSDPRQLELLELAREASLDASLESDLRSGGADLLTTLAPLADEVDRGFASLRLESTVRPDGAELVTPFLVHVGTTELGAPLETSVSSIAAVGGRDAVAIAGLEVRAPAGSLWIDAFEARAHARGSDGLAGVLRESAACGTVVTLVAREGVLPSCDASCVRAGCAAAAALVLADMRARASDTDAALAVLRVDATVTSADEDDDLVADRLSGSFEARWESADGASVTTVASEWSAVRDDALE